jgi:phosphoglycolate phosphatase
VVFDLDGTLVDTAPDLAGSLNHCLARAGLEPTTLAEVRPDAGRGAQAMLRAAYARAGHPRAADELAGQTARFLEHYAANIAEASTLYPGVVHALDRLAADGSILAVCTNKTEALAVRLLDALGLSSRFAAICGADTFAGRKPDPVHLHGTIDRAGGHRAHAVLVGDSETDMEAARRAFVPGILVSFGYDAGALVRAMASATIDGFGELEPRLLDRLTSAFLPRPL